MIANFLLVSSLVDLVVGAGIASDFWVSFIFSLPSRRDIFCLIHLKIIGIIKTAIHVATIPISSGTHSNHTSLYNAASKITIKRPPARYDKRICQGLEAFWIGSKTYGYHTSVTRASNITIAETVKRTLLILSSIKYGGIPNTLQYPRSNAYANP